MFGQKILFYKKQEFGTRNTFATPVYLTGHDEFGTRNWGLTADDVPASDRSLCTHILHACILACMHVISMHACMHAISMHACIHAYDACKHACLITEKTKLSTAQQNREEWTNEASKYPEFVPRRPIRDKVLILDAKDPKPVLFFFMNLSLPSPFVLIPPVSVPPSLFYSLSLLSLSLSLPLFLSRPLSHPLSCVSLSSISLLPPYLSLTFLLSHRVRPRRRRRRRARRSA